VTNLSKVFLHRGRVSKGDLLCSVQEVHGQTTKAQILVSADWVPAMEARCQQFTGTDQRYRGLNGQVLISAYRRSAILGKPSEQ